MRFHRTSAIVLRQFYLLRGSPVRVIPLFAWVAIDIVLWGFITRYLNTITAAGFDFVPVLLGAVLLWDFFTRVMHGVTMAFLEDVWSRNFLNLFASPLTISEYLGGLVLSSIATSSAGLLMMVVLASAVFGLSFFAYGLLLVPFLLVLFLFGIALGIFGSALVPAVRTGVRVARLAHSRPPLAVRRGLLSGLDPPALDAARLAPAASVIRVRGDAGDPGGRRLWGSRAGMELVLSVLYILLASWFFSRIHRQAVRSGLLARYSAESVA